MLEKWFRAATTTQAATSTFASTIIKIKIKTQNAKAEKTLNLSPTNKKYFFSSCSVNAFENICFN